MWLLWSAVSSSLVGLSSDIGRSSVGGLEVSSEEWVEGISEEDLGTTELWESKPQDEGKLEHVIHWEPVGWLECTLKDTQEGEDNPVS